MKPESISPGATPGTSLSRIRYEKSERAFRTISEVATELDVAQHVLRFWESKFSQVRPVQRNGGRRYYRPEDVDLLRRIRSLLYDDGYTIKGVQRLLNETGARSAAICLSAIAAPSRDRLPEQVALPTPNTKLEGAKRREVENVLSDLENALNLLRTTLHRQ